MGLWKAVVDFSKMVKLSHTVFALPFALVAVVIIYKNGASLIGVKEVIYIVLAFTGARSFSMAFNRIVDARIDARNPRTANREIPSGVLSGNQVWVFALLSLIVLWVFAWLLSPVAFYLSFPVLALLAGYSYAKRFTWFCHIWLGAVIGLAPIGVDIALTQSLTLTSGILFGILTTYIAGFDILYSIQDVNFDRENGLQSIPVRFGIHVSLWISTFLHLLACAGFFLFWQMEGFGMIFLGGAVLLTLLVFAEHFVVGWGKNVKKDRIPMAFFHFNSSISILFLVSVLADVFSGASL
ncbi:MAG: UbiA-like polyprenyltransferase [Leptospirales bacterium]